MGEAADLERELTQSLAREAALTEVLAVMSRGPADLQAVLEVVATNAARYCAAEDATVMVIRGDRMDFVAHHGSIPWADEPEWRVDPSRLTGRAIHERRTISVPDMAAPGEFAVSRERATPHGVRSVVVAPLLKGADVLGAIMLRRLQVRPFAEREIALLRAFSDQAAIAIENSRLLNAVRRQRDELSRFISPQVAQVITSEDGTKLLEGHRAQITVVFFDIRGFTAFAESAEPEEVLEVLRTYQSAMGEIAFAHQGTLEHFVGDGAMVFFNDPVPVDGHELRAVQMAVAMRTRFEELASDWRRRGYDLGFGAGAAVGHATLGRTGFEGRYDYGAVGNVVILGARLASEAKSGQVLISQRLFATVEEHVVVEPVDALALKGISRPITAKNVVRLR